MDSKIKEYRTKHHKCKWCKYYKYNSPSTRIPGLSCPDYETCELKDKIIHFVDWLNICKYYELKEDKNEVQINKANESAVQCNRANSNK